MKIRSHPTAAALTALTGPAVAAALLVGAPVRAVVVEPEAPQVTATTTCSDVSAANGTATITIVNPPDNGDPRTYSWTVSGPVSSVGAVSVADGASEAVSRTGLMGGVYSVSVVDALDPSLTASTSFTVEDCLVPPPTTTTTTTTSTTTTIAPDPTTTAPSGATSTTPDPGPTAPPTTGPSPATLPATGASSVPIMAVALVLGSTGLALWGLGLRRRVSS